MASEVKGRRATHYFFIFSFLLTIILAVGLASTAYTGTEDGATEPGEKGSYKVYGVEIPS